MIQREHSLLHHIRTIFESGTISELSDRQLLERFAAGDPETAELCFAALIKRHGPMVVRTCQAILHDAHDAEDAFQATFLILARKARSLWVRDSLGPWLFQVASRVAACARSAAQRRRSHERKAAREAASTVEEPTWDDSGAVLCEELERLPDRYRAAVVLCDLEGFTQEKAAQLLGWPEGTLRSRLARGRERLRSRLVRRGLAPSVAPGLPLLTGEAPRAAVPAPLAEITTTTAVQMVASRTAAGATAAVGALTKGALRIMFFSKLKLLSAGILAGGLFAGTAVLAYYAGGQKQGRTPAAQAEGPAKEDAGRKSHPGASDAAGLQSLSPNAKARLDVARKLRGQMYNLYRIDPNQRFSEFLRCQNRYHEVVEAVLVKTDADRVRFLEYRLAILRRTEAFIEEMARGAGTNPPEILAARLDRLEAEDRLEQATAKLRAAGAAPESRESSDLVQFLSQDTWAPGFSDFQPPPPSPNAEPRRR